MDAEPVPSAASAFIDCAAGHRWEPSPLLSVCC